MSDISDNHEIAVSIVVPIFNAELHLRECLDSLVNQTLPNIEILCYDDASTDSSGDIAAQFARSDQRVTLTTYPENRSSSQARKDGTLAARGSYLMFVDADDYLDPAACAALVERARDLQVDVLQFGTSVISASSDAVRIRRLQRQLAPLERRLSGAEPFTQCFLTGRYSHTLWNKIYRTSFAQHAFEAVPDGRFPKAQDLLAYFLLAWHARSYQGIPERYYHYRFGAGITGAEDVSLERLTAYAEQSLVADAVDSFASAHTGDEQLHLAARLVRQRLVSDCVTQWFHRMAPETASSGFDVLAAAWPMPDLTAALHRQLHDQRQGLALRIDGARSIARREAPIPPGGTLGIFYHRLSIGGVQRVLSILIPMYLRMGYRVVMFIDRECTGDGFALPAEVPQVVLPLAGADYRDRGQRIQQVIRAEGIDAFIHCAGSSQILLYDLLVAKAEGIPFLLSIHNSAFSALVDASRELAIRPPVAKLADIAQVLSEAERAYWSSQGVNAVFLPNPVTTAVVDESELAVEPGMLLWVGRLDLWVKRCLDVVEAMAVVARSAPEARLYIVGEEWNSGTTEKIRERIRRLGLEETVTLCGPTTQVEDYYRRAEVVVITSVTECSPMTVVEARAFGVPIAMYTLPHLASLQDGKGFIAVPQGETASLARAIVSILRDPELRDDLSRAGREGLEQQAAFDLEAAWRRFFAMATEPRSAASNQPLDSATVGALLSNALDIHTLGAVRRRERTVEFRGEIKQLQQQLEDASKPAEPAPRRDTRLVPRRLRALLGRLRRILPYPSRRSPAKGR